MSKRRRPLLTCVPPPELPEQELLAAASRAIDVNPANAPAIGVAPWFLAVSRYWGAAGVDLTVSFLEQTAADLRDRIVSHLNAWGEFANVRFRWTAQGGQVRITRARGGGYYSYLGPDILGIPAGRPTMSLEAFTMQTSESEYRRVVRHEAGHTLGFPHEHMRRELVDLLDVQKTIAHFQRTQGWDERTTRQQVLTALDERSIMGSASADATSIMCYQLSGACTKTGKPIPGGLDFDEVDRTFAARLYPKAITPPPPPPPPSGGEIIFTVGVDPRTRVVRVVSS